MRHLKWLAALCALLLIATALAEDAETALVEGEVGEIEFSLDGPEDLPGDDFEPAPATPTPSPTPSPSPTPFVPPYPDVTSPEIRARAQVSPRVYPSALIWPVPGQEPLRHVTSRVGWRNAAHINRGQASWLHHGVDVGGVDTDTPILAAEGGLAYAEYRDGLGLCVVIDHENGWYTRYQHLSAYAGEITPDCRAVVVNAGDVIGYAGNTGGNYPVHLHFEIVWSPTGPGADAKIYRAQTQNRTIRAWSYAWQSAVEMHWAKTWEICSAENQMFVALTLEEVLGIGQ